MGYKKTYIPTHPSAMSCGCVYTHRLVMEQHLGRYLESYEQVHHRDEDKGNNCIENLQLCASHKEHAEQHAYDDDELIRLLVLYSDYRGQLPSKRQCDREPQLPNSSTYIRHFGSWSAAKALAQTHIDVINDSLEFDYYQEEYL